MEKDKYTLNNGYEVYLNSTEKKYFEGRIINNIKIIDYFKTNLFYDEKIYLEPEFYILLMGGTIASFGTAGCGVKSSNETFIKFLKILFKSEQFKVISVCDKLSENIDKNDLYSLKNTIQNLNNDKPIIICHGTDTISRTAAYLKLTVFNKNILLISTQKDLTRPGSRGIKLLRAAVQISRKKIKGVYVISPSEDNNSFKIHCPQYIKKKESYKRDTFISLNSNLKGIYFFNVNYLKINLKIKNLEFEGKKGIFKEELLVIKYTYGIEKILTELKLPNIKNIIIIGFGLGNIPSNLFRTWPKNKQYYISTNCFNGPLRNDIYHNENKQITLLDNYSLEWYEVFLDLI